MDVLTLAPKTLKEYNSLLDNRIIPALGHLKLSNLQPTHLTEFYNNLREDGIRTDKRSGKLSENTILHYHRLIASILTSAVRWGYILTNPAERLVPPKIQKKEAKYFEEDDIKYILELLEAEPLKYRVMVYMAVLVGLRLGELDGLTWDDISLDNKTIEIHQASQYISGQGIITKDTKNSSSNRLLSLPDSVVSVLRLYKVWQNGEKASLGNLWEGKKNDNTEEDKKKDDRLFTQRYGKPIHPTTPSKWFSKFLKRHNESIMNDNIIPDDMKEQYLLPEVNFHGLRHTNATLLIGNGVNITTVSKRLGHAKVSTTTDIYSHSLRKADTEASEKLDSMFNKNNRLKKQG